MAIIEYPLVLGIAVHRGHKPALYTHSIKQDFGQRRKAIGRTRGTRHHPILGS